MVLGPKGLTTRGLCRFIKQRRLLVKLAFLQLDLYFGKANYSTVKPLINDQSNPYKQPVLYLLSSRVF